MYSGRREGISSWTFELNLHLVRPSLSNSHSWWLYFGVEAATQWLPGFYNDFRGIREDNKDNHGKMAVVRAAGDNIAMPGQSPGDRRAQTVTVTVAFSLTCILLCLFTRLYMRWPWSKMISKKTDGLAVASTVGVERRSP